MTVLCTHSPIFPEFLQVRSLQVRMFPNSIPVLLGIIVVVELLQAGCPFCRLNNSSEVFLYTGTYYLYFVRQVYATS